MSKNLLTPVIDRLEAKIERITESGCWIFTGSINREGYGKIGLGGRTQGVDRAHRVTYRHYKGDIPQGLELDHLCRVRSCCNPDHLEPVTRKENCRRGDCGKVTGAQHREKTHCKHGHEFSDAKTYRWTSPGNGITSRICIACRNARRRIGYVV